MHKFWHSRKQFSAFLRWLLIERALKIIIDVFHFKNHNDDYCRKYVDPGKCDLLKAHKCNTSAGEQGFSWLARSKHMLGSMNEARFMFSLLRMMHLRNKWLIGESLPLRADKSD